MAVKDAPAYPWYQVVKGEGVTQGDILYDCPLLIPDPDEVLLKAIEGGDEQLSANIPIQKANLIVMTQACDLEHEKVNSVVLCPVWPLVDFSNDVSNLQSDKGKEQLRKGYFPPFHLLNEDEDFKFNFQVVDFRELYTIPTKVLRLIASKT